MLPMPNSLSLSSISIRQGVIREFCNQFHRDNPMSRRRVADVHLNGLFLRLLKAAMFRPALDQLNLDRGSFRQVIGIPGYLAFLARSSVMASSEG